MFRLGVILLLLAGCASSGPMTVDQRLQIMHACKNAGGVWYTYSHTPEWDGKCDWKQIDRF